MHTSKKASGQVDANEIYRAGTLESTKVAEQSEREGLRILGRSLEVSN